MPVRALLIDPYTRTVASVPLPEDPGDYQGVARLIGAREIQEFNLRRADDRLPGITLYAEEDGVARPSQKFWCFRNALDRIFPGPCLVATTGFEGEPVAALSEPAEVEPHVKWLNVRFSGYAGPDDPLFALPRKPLFEEIQ